MRSTFGVPDERVEVWAAIRVGGCLLVGLAVLETQSVAVGQVGTADTVIVATLVTACAVRRTVGTWCAPERHEE